MNTEINYPDYTLEEPYILDIPNGITKSKRGNIEYIDLGINNYINCGDLYKEALIKIAPNKEFSACIQDCDMTISKTITPDDNNQYVYDFNCVKFCDAIYNIRFITDNEPLSCFVRLNNSYEHIIDLGECNFTYYAPLPYFIYSIGFISQHYEENPLILCDTIFYNTDYRNKFFTSTINYDFGYKWSYNEGLKPTFKKS